MVSGPGAKCASTMTPVRSPSGRIDSTISATDPFTSIAKRSTGFGLTMLRRSSMKRFKVASSRSMVRWNMARDSPSLSSRRSRRELLPMF